VNFTTGAAFFTGEDQLSIGEVPEQRRHLTMMKRSPVLASALHES
jgi:hypothetical protein